MQLLRQVQFSVSAVAIAALFCCGGCRLGGGGHDDAHVRMINAIPNVDELSVAIDGQRVWKHSQYRNNTGYQGISEGSYEVRMDASGPGSTLAALKPMAFEKGHFYTVLVMGLAHRDSQSPSVRVFEDDKAEAVPDGKARLRFINAAGGIGPTDVLFNNIVGLHRIDPGRRSKTLLLDEGTYDIKVNPVGYVTPLMGPINLRLQPGRSYTLVAMGQHEGDSLALEAYTDD